MTNDLVSGGQGMSTEKDRIAKAALAEVPDEGAILLDAGSTISRLAMALPADRELTIVTNSIALAQNLCEQPNFTVMVLGGRVRSRSLSVVDSWVLRTLADIYVDVAFIATDGVSADHGLTVTDAAAAMVKRAAVAAARRTVLLAEHTKIGKNHLAKFADLGDIDTFITDTGIDPLQAQQIASTGSRLVTT
jgi:DeoR family fructose operon transcriptional repressor